MASSRYPLEDIRARCDLVEIVSPYVALKRSGKNLKGLCPFHTEKTPSFIVNSDTQRWMCFGCGENGDVFTFLMRIEGLTFPEAVEQLADRVGVDISRAEKDVRSAEERDVVLRANNLAASFFRKALAASDVAKDYLRRRGLTPEAVEKFKLGYAPNDWSALADYLRRQKVKPEDAAKAGLLIARENGTGYYDRFRNRLMFPIFDVQDRVIGFGGRALADADVKYINSPETKVFIKNRTLYALNFARKAIIDQDCAVLVEGYMDVVTAHAAGFVNVVATMGTALTPEHVNVLSRYTRHAVLALDSDSAGMSATFRSAPMFEAADLDVKVAAMPEGEDPDSLIRKGDLAAFAECISGAVPIPDFRLRAVAAKHDVETRDGQLAVLKEAIPIVAEVERQVERERLIALLAPYHPNYRGGVTPAEVHIRREVESHRSKAASRHAQPHRAPGPVRQEKQDLLSEEGKAVRKAECELLGKILCLGARPADIFSHVPPEQFSGDDTKAIASAVQEEIENGGILKIDTLSLRLAGGPGETLLNEIFVRSAESSDTPLADLIGTIKTYRKKEQEKRFRTLADKIQRGEIKRTDNEFAEYWQLVRELHT